MRAVEQREQRHTGHKADGCLRQVCCDGGFQTGCIAEQRQLIQEIADDHDDLRCDGAEQRTGEGLAEPAAVLCEGTEDQGGGERHQSLDDQCAGSVDEIAADDVGQRGADAACRCAPDRTEHEGTEQHHAVAEVEVAADRRGNVDDHRGHTGQRGEHGGQDQGAELCLFHNGFPLLLFMVKPIIL